ncbi:hypothetical protein FSARC_13333, partial [Fusarium sarcochroum]
MRYSTAATLASLLASSVLASPVYSSPPKAHEIVEIPNVWIENTAIRSNGNLLLNSIGDGKLYSLNPTQSPPTPQVIAQIDSVNSLFGITEVGKDVFAIAGGDFNEGLINNTMSVSLVKFAGNKPSVHT